MLPVDTFKIRKHLLTLFLATPSQEGRINLKNLRVFLMGKDVRYSTISFYKNVLKLATH
jgi:hypothetical protein